MRPYTMPTKIQEPALTTNKLYRFCDETVLIVWIGDQGKTVHYTTLGGCRSKEVPKEEFERLAEEVSETEVIPFLFENLISLNDAIVDIRDEIESLKQDTRDMGYERPWTR